MNREKGLLMDEIEKSLWNLTEDNLRYLCEHHGHDGSEVKGMDHRSLRRKIMEEMWDNTDSMKLKKQGISWLVRLKEDIRRMLEDASSAPSCPLQAEDDCDEEWSGEGGAGLPSNMLEAESMSPRQSNDAADCDVEGTDWLPSNRLEAELSPERHTLEQRVRGDTSLPPPSTLPKTLCRASPGSALIWGLKRVSVQLMDCRKPPGQKTCKKTHSCAQCGKSFATKDILERHLLTQTGEKQKNICAECGKVFSTFSSLTRHLKTHTEEKCHVSETTCSECGKTFSTHSSLKRHLLTHTGEKLYVCPRCGKSFNDPGNLKKHIFRTHSGEHSEEEPSENNVDSSEQVRHPCSHCGKKLSTKTRLKIHLKTHTGEKPHVCPDSGKSFAFRPSLTKHQKLSHSEHGVKRQECSVCEKVFNQPGALRSHQRTHTGEKPH
uniref:C2H2-type domain-containing protein n=1 Tax=Hucho hucho TaxID=62062 RepID=A0A4W5JUS8_9TELE